MQLQGSIGPATGTCFVFSAATAARSLPAASALPVAPTAPAPYCKQGSAGARHVNGEENSPHPSIPLLRHVLPASGLSPGSPCGRLLGRLGTLCRLLLPRRASGGSTAAEAAEGGSAPANLKRQGDLFGVSSLGCVSEPALSEATGPGGGLTSFGGRPRRRPLFRTAMLFCCCFCGCD